MTLDSKLECIRRSAGGYFLIHELESSEEIFSIDELIEVIKLNYHFHAKIGKLNLGEKSGIHGFYRVDMLSGRNYHNIDYSTFRKMIKKQIMEEEFDSNCNFVKNIFDVIDFFSLKKYDKLYFLNLSLENKEYLNAFSFYSFFYSYVAYRDRDI